MLGSLQAIFSIFEVNNNDDEIFFVDYVFNADDLIIPNRTR